MTRRSAATRADDAASALDAYLRDRPRPAGAGQTLVQEPSQAPDGVPASDDMGTWETVGREVRDEVLAVPSRTDDDRPVEAPRPARDRSPPLHTDWLAHTLEVTGPAAALAAFGQAAAGAGIIPWALDGDVLEEDAVLRLVASGPGAPGLVGSRILARQLRDAAEHRHALALACVGRSAACPFDLHRLVPVPEGLLPLGPEHPDALAWLWAHWGTTAALRHVARSEPARPSPPAGEDRLAVRFWAADWTPWQALARIGADWPALRIAVRPLYDRA